MSREHVRHNLLESFKTLRRWDRQLVWLSGIGICTLTWTALAILALRTL